LKRAIVFAAGGAKGAYAVGILKRYLEIGKSYDIAIGTSTGALIAPFAASENIDALIEGYTSINHSDIFNVNPFKIKKAKNGIYKWDINKLAIFYNRYLLRQPSFGSTKNLRNKTIPKFFSYEDYEKIIESRKDLCICVSNATLDVCEVKNIKEYGYDKFCDWMWASTCAPPVMSVPKIDGYEYVDGAVTKPVPIDEAIIRGADEIDVIILDTKYSAVNKIEKIRSDTQLQLRTNHMLMDRLMKYNVNLASLADLANKNIKINFHYTEKILTNNSLIFDKNMMREWLNLGYDYAVENKKESYVLLGNLNKYVKINKRHRLLKNKTFRFDFD